MEKFKNIMKNLGASVQLTARERESMDEHIREYITHNPMRSFDAPTPTYVALLRYRFSAVLVVLALLFTSGVGVSYASTQALPGDTLYPVKELGEEITERLIFDETKRVEYAIERVHKRLQEIEALAAQGKLNTETEALATEKFEESSGRAEARIALLEEDEPAQAEALRITLAIGIEARTDVLAMHTNTMDEKEDDARTRVARAIQPRPESADDSRATVSALRVATNRAVGTEEEKSGSTIESTVMFAAESLPKVQDVARPPALLATLVRSLHVQREILKKEIDKTRDEDIQEDLKEVFDHINKTQIEITNAIRAGKHIEAERLVKDALRTVHTTISALEADVDLPKIGVPEIQLESEPETPFIEGSIKIETLPNTRVQ